MARAFTQEETLFELAPDGGMVFPAEEPAVAEVAAVDLHDPDAWQDSSGRFVTPGERALIAVAPNEVNIADRAGHLTMALTALAEANRDRG